MRGLIVEGERDAGCSSFQGWLGAKRVPRTYKGNVELLFVTGEAWKVGQSAKG